MDPIIRWYRKPLVSWIVRTLFYMAILCGLIIIYGFAAARTGTFIYNDF